MGMGDRKPKTPKAPGPTRGILSFNLSTLIDRHYRSLANVTQRQKALEKDSGVRLSTIQRLVNEQTGANLETLEALAGAFGIDPDELIRRPANVRPRLAVAATGPRPGSERVPKNIDLEHTARKKLPAVKRRVTKAI